MGSDLHSDRRTSGRCEARTVPLARNFARLFPKSKKHPYSFVGHDGGKELNPDLSSRWVQEFLEKQGAWDTIEAALGRHNTTLGILGLRDRYGVLIAPLWEELVCGMTLDQSLCMTLAIQEARKDDAEPDGCADKSELPIQPSRASVPSHGTAGQDAEGDAELEQHSTSTSSARKRPADETSPLPRPKHKRKKRHCHDAEDDMMQSDAELGAMEEQMTTEVNQEFHNDRSTHAISRQRKILMGPDFESGTRNGVLQSSVTSRLL
ncbi:hypothetical protein J3458_009591 [Metarhizium acridum]|uniref:uncharacterized protein n=1 Tax=Metarhizium acridum TaxID=92637 RepID=UPI001C6C343C|nr:hypothetical protein J3458_009591 [Metarhizium acridum]